VYLPVHCRATVIAQHLAWQTTHEWGVGDVARAEGAAKAQQQDMLPLVQLAVLPVGADHAGLELPSTMLASMLKWTAVLACRLELGDRLNGSMEPTDYDNVELF